MGGIWDLILVCMGAWNYLIMLRRLCIWINPIIRGHIFFFFFGEQISGHIIYIKKKKKTPVIYLYPHGDNVVKKFFCRPK